MSKRRPRRLRDRAPVRYLGTRPYMTLASSRVGAEKSLIHCGSRTAWRRANRHGTTDQMVPSYECSMSSRRVTRRGRSVILPVGTRDPSARALRFCSSSAPLDFVFPANFSFVPLAASLCGRKARKYPLLRFVSGRAPLRLERATSFERISKQASKQDDCRRGAKTWQASVFIGSRARCVA